MKKITFLLIVLMTASTVYAQLIEEEVESKRKEHATELSDTSAGVLNATEIEEFGGLDYFEFDSTFQIVATFTKKKGRSFEMPTSTDRKPWYRRYGYVDFVVDGIACRLEVYQNLELKQSKEYRDYLFIPFRDLTSSKSTYGGGRYLDVRIPPGEELLLDFNLSYNPYCAYSYRYSCPIPPAVNTLKVKINAGEKTPLEH